MRLRTFLHGDENSPTTLSEIQRAHDWIDSEEYLGIFAYATQSGASSFNIAMPNIFWAATQSRWLFGLDYGRTQPQALRIISGKPNAEVRIYDGAWIVEQNGFLPRRDFHAKSSILANLLQHVARLRIARRQSRRQGIRGHALDGAEQAVHREVEARERPRLFQCRPLHLLPRRPGRLLSVGRPVPTR